MEIGKSNYINIFYLYVLKSNKYLLFIFSISVSFFLPLIVSSFTGRLYNNDVITQGYLQAPSDLFGAGIFGVPFLSLFIVYYSEKSSHMILKLKNDNIINIANDRFNILKDKYSNYYNSSLNKWFILPALFANAFWVIPFLTDGKITWITYAYESGEKLYITGYILFIIMTIYFYCLFLIVYYFFITAFFLRDISREADIIITPLHPDNCGGLSNIGKLSFYNSIFIVFVGLGVVTVLISEVIYLGYPLFNFVHVLMLTLYFTLAPLTFFIPLLFFKKPMKDKKFETLEILSDKYNEVYHGVFSDNRLDDHEFDIIEKLDKIKYIYDMVKKMPVWPYNVKTVKNFLIVVVSPIVAVGVPIIIDKFVNIYLK